MLKGCRGHTWDMLYGWRGLLLVVLGAGALLAGRVPLLAQSVSEVGLEKIGDAEEQAGHETNPKLRPFC